MKKVFIDGKEGTTGLRIFDRLKDRKDIQLILLSEEDRKNPICRKQAINESDITILCLPDDIARESVSMVENENTIVIDCSTAHRTEPDWIYAFPELYKDFEQVAKQNKRFAVPGCHASGIIALIKPLIDNKLLKNDALLAVTSITGYSGGGKKMIADYEKEEKDNLLNFPRQYAISQNHKHLKEIVSICGLDNTPQFMPIVSGFYSGMQVSIPIFKGFLQNNKSIEDIKDIYKSQYNSNVVYYSEENENGFLSSGILSGKDSMSVSVFGNEDRILLVARYDNLGKGASGAAVECLNYILGVDKVTDLEL